MAQAASQSRTVEANEFILRDASGHVRGEFSAGSDSARLALWDKRRRAAISLGMAQNGPVLSLGDSAGRLRAGLFLNSDAPDLCFFDGNSNKAAELYAGPDSVVLHLTRGTQFSCLT